MEEKSIGGGEMELEILVTIQSPFVIFEIKH
jgi:hypothetical protein